MSDTLEQHAETIIGKVLELPTGERMAAAARECGADRELLGRVMSLLSADPLVQGFMDATAAPPFVAPASTAPVGEKPGDSIGRYKLLEKIGEGGFGVVFMAEQQHPVRRRVALKVIKLGMDTREVVARFEAERQALAMMDHPNIARVLDAGATDAGRPYFVMELVRGSPVTEYADKHKLSTRDRVALAAQICRAVQHAHSKGVIHRDIKPNNVLVTVADDKPVPKVIDFGIAKATQAKLTEMTLFTAHRQLIGTPQYMSPEQADSDGVDVDTRTDVYSLGVLIYEMLVGTTPLDARSLRSAAFEVMRKMIVEVEAPRPSTRLSSLGDTVTTIATNRNTDVRQLGRQLSGELDWIVMRALEKERSRRYDTAAALADDLGRYLAGEAVLAGPVSGTYRLRKLARRYKATLGVVAVVAAVLLLGVAGTTIGLLRETHQRKIADLERAVATQARQTAETAATTANRAAARSDARYLTGESLLPAAYTRAVDAWKLGGKWEDGFTLDRIRSAAQQHWKMVAKIPVEGANVGCIIRTAGGPVLAVVAGENLTTYNATNGQMLGQTALESSVFKLIANDTMESVTVVRPEGVDRFTLNGLKRVAIHELDAPPVAVDANENQIAIVDRDGTTRVLSLTDLAQTARLVYEPATTDMGIISRPHLVAISPSGHRILLRGGAWTEAYTLWEPGIGTEPSKITHREIRANRFRFIDEQAVLAWFTPDQNGGYSTEAYVYILPEDEAERSTVVFSGSVPSDDTKSELDVQTWPTTGDAGENIALIGGSGVATLQTSVEKNLQTDRYANLLPNSQAPTFLTASFASGLLVLAQPHGVAVFSHESARQEFKMDDFAAHGCRDGLFWVRMRKAGAGSLFLEPFDPTRPPRTFSLQWAHGTGETPDLMPWAVCSTPDGSTVVVVTQGSKNFDNTVAATFGVAHALVYRNAGGLDAAPPVWQLDHAWDLNVAPTATWEPRHAAVDPAGQVLLYVTANGGARRFSLIDGRTLGALPMARVAHLSDDGKLAAGIDSAEGNLNVFNIATGERVMSIPGQGQATAVCLSADNQRVMVADGMLIRQYAVPDGQLISTIPVPLRPLAVPAGDLDRFVAFQPDGPKTSSGNLVMADREGHVVTVLVRTGTNFCPAQLSPDGQSVAMITERWRGEIFRSLSPAMMAAALEPTNSVSADQAETGAMPVVQMPPSAVPVGTFEVSDNDGLEAHLGQAVAVHGRIGKVGRNANHSVAFLDIVPVTGGGRTLTGFVSSKAMHQFISAGGVDHLDELRGHQVILSGSLVRYTSKTGEKATLEIVIDDRSQMKVAPGQN